MKKLFLSVLAIAAASTMMAAGVEAHYSLALGYNHSYMRASTNVPEMTKQDLKDHCQYFNFDGFEFGGLVDLDFVGAAPGNNVLGLQLGLMYTFGDYDFYQKDSEMKQEREKVYEEAKEMGYKVKLSSHNYMHVLSVPVRFKYSYQFNDAWALNVYTGPELRFNVALQYIDFNRFEEEETSFEEYSRFDYVSGKVYGYAKVDGEKEEYNEEAIDKDRRVPVFDLAWGFGVGASWKNLSLTVRYDLGLMNLEPAGNVKPVKDAGYKFAMNRDAIAVTLGYRIK